MIANLVQEQGLDLPAPAAIVLAHLTRHYDKIAALDDVNITVPAGSLCGLIGPNGAGKTTLLSILATLDEEWSGQVTIAGWDVRLEPQHVRRLMGFVPDAAQVYDELTVAAYLSFFAAAHRLRGAAQLDAVDRVLDLVGLSQDADRPAAGLSKGMTQRLSVGRALLHDPEVLFLDEPASGLDPRARIELKQLLKKLQRRGKTVLISSHNLTELGDFCDHVVVMEQGKVVAAGAISELWDSLHERAPDRRQIVIEVLTDPEGAVSLLESVPELSTELSTELSKISHVGHLITVETDGGPASVAAIVKRLVLAGHDVVRVSPERENLEALFLTVTKGAVQ